MRRFIFTVATIMALAACAPSGKGGGRSPSATNGGVDVGNLTSSAVPQTNASISYSTKWSATIQTNLISIYNKSGSVIAARKSEITDLASPTAVALQQYLKQKHPDRDYKIINFNGLEGVRADLVNTHEQKRSDLYLVSELKDFIHIQSDLKKADDGIAQGDQIILTVRVKYQGVPYPNAQVKTVTLEARTGGPIDRHAYSLWGDCYLYSDRGCNPSGGVAVTYEGNFGIGTAGYAHGRVVELGPESQIPFDSIRVEGEYLVAPISKIPIADIYTAFTPKDPQVDQDSITLKEGYVYLVRTINWPDEDLVTKMRVERVEGGKSATITYQKLVYVKRAELQKQIDAINKYTVEYEMPLAAGEVTLFNRSVWHNYFYASFNFEYSTSGNMFITHNGWDLNFSQGCSGEPSFHVPHSGGAIGLPTDLGAKDIRTVTMADFPNPNDYKSVCGVEVVKGHTYAIYHYDYGNENASAVFGVVQVLDLDPKNKWVRLKFRRIKVGPADYFQRWLKLGVPQGIQSVTLEHGQDGSKSVFYPFINKRQDQAWHYYERMGFSKDGGSADYFSVDSRPYGNKRGFYRLGKNVPLDSVTQAHVEALRGKFEGDFRFQAGDVIAVLLENYYDKTVMVMKVEHYVPRKSVVLSIRYIYRGKTVYSDDKD